MTTNTQVVFKLQTNKRQNEYSFAKPLKTGKLVVYVKEKPYEDILMIKDEHTDSSIVEVSLPSMELKEPHPIFYLSAYDNTGMAKQIFSREGIGMHTSRLPSIGYHLAKHGHMLRLAEIGAMYTYANERYDGPLHTNDDADIAGIILYHIEAHQRESESNE